MNIKICKIVMIAVPKRSALYNAPVYWCFEGFLKERKTRVQNLTSVSDR
jgi:hypothetical protein